MEANYPAGRGGRRLRPAGSAPVLVLIRILAVDRPFLAVHGRLAVGRGLVTVSRRLVAVGWPAAPAPGRPYDHPEHHPEHAYQHQDVTDGVNGDAVRGHGGDTEPQDGSHRYEQKTCTDPHVLTSVERVRVSHPSSRGRWAQTGVRA